MPNCKQGEMAIIVKSVSGNEGRIVTCVRPATLEELGAAFGGGGAARPLDGIDRLVWLIDQKIPCRVMTDGVLRTEYVPYCLDQNMRPLPPLSEKEEDHDQLDLPQQAERAAVD